MKKRELVNPVKSFKDYHKTIKAPVAIYADFETFIQKLTIFIMTEQVQQLN